MTEGAKDERIVIPREKLTYEYDGKTEYVHELVLAQLLMDEVCFVNTGTTRGDEYVYCFVGCSDVFAWAFADAEPVTREELPALYEMHMADTTWGAAMWCIKKRRELPQPPVLRAMKEAGAWDLDESAIGPNVTDAETQALFAQAAALQRGAGDHSGR